jgi:hypothetical protein
MAPRKRSLAQRKYLWGIVTRNFEVVQEEVPHLRQEVGDLEALDNEVSALLALQAQYQAKSQEITKKIRVLSKQADNLRGRIGAGLRGHFGFTSQILVKLGFKTYRTRHKLERELEDLARDAEIAGKAVPPADQPQGEGE